MSTQAASSHKRSLTTRPGTRSMGRTCSAPTSSACPPACPPRPWSCPTATSLDLRVAPVDPADRGRHGPGCWPTTGPCPARHCASARAQRWTSPLRTRSTSRARSTGMGCAWKTALTARMKRRRRSSRERASHRIRCPDPGVYWYHPHIREDYGQELGLYGNVLVVPAEPEYWPPVHREVLLTVDDILIEDGQVAAFSRRGRRTRRWAGSATSCWWAVSRSSR